MAHRDRKAGVIAATRFPVTIRLAALGLLALVCAGCLWPNYDAIGPLKQMPEATLYYPGAKVVQEVANPRTYGPDGQQGASYGHNLAVNATPDAVIAWYDQQLTARGWTRDKPPILGGYQLTAALWRKPGVYIEVGIESAPTQSDDPDTPAFTGYNLALSVSIYEDWPAESPSPS
jgi:hypothetical protein